LRRGNGLDQLDDGGVALLLEVERADDVDGQGGGLGRSGDVGAGDDDFADLRGGGGLGGLSGRAFGQSKCQDDGQNRAAAEISALQHDGFSSP
jgi:hypothetical protein